jgi:hypothetical protein
MNIHFLFLFYFPNYVSMFAAHVHLFHFSLLANRKGTCENTSLSVCALPHITFELIRGFGSDFVWGAINGT